MQVGNFLDDRQAQARPRRIGTAAAVEAAPTLVLEGLAVYTAHAADEAS